jgi:hypothetical protein
MPAGVASNRRLAMGANILIWNSLIRRSHLLAPIFLVNRGNQYAHNGGGSGVPVRRDHQLSHLIGQDLANARLALQASAVPALGIRVGCVCAVTVDVRMRPAR